MVNTDFYLVISGVYLTLEENVIVNNNDVLLTNIREGDEGALLCFTDNRNCCRNEDAQDNSGALGGWIFPNGSTVTTGNDIYTTRGHGVLRLNRRNNATSPTGEYCCMVLDASSINKSMCANIGLPDGKWNSLL